MAVIAVAEPAVVAAEAAAGSFVGKTDCEVGFDRVPQPEPAPVAE